MQRLLFFGASVIALILLAGCGSGYTTGPVTASPLTHDSSSSGDLLYVGHGTKRKNDLSLYTYPGNAFVRSIPGVSFAKTMCTDTSGNVFVRDSAGLQEFTHGGTTPINTLSIAGPCAYDLTTNDLAVLNGTRVDIYTNESGTPQVYGPYNSVGFSTGTYDDSGSLYIIDGPDATWGLLRFSSGEFTPISLDKSISISRSSSIQFDGTNLVVETSSTLYQIRVSGSRGHVVGEITLSGYKYMGSFVGGWLQGNTFITPVMNAEETHYGVGFWSYPSGGSPEGKQIKTNSRVYSVVVSVAP